MLRQLDDNDNNIVLEYLDRNEEGAAFLTGNVLRYGIVNRRNILRCGDYFGYFEGNSLKGIVAFYNLSSCVPHYESSEAVSCFSQLMAMRRFSMLLGEDNIVRPLYEIIRRYKYVREFEECSYCVNRNFTPFRLEGTEFSDVNAENMNDVAFVRKAYLLGFGVERTVEDTKLLLLQKSEEEDFIILSQNTKPVAQACIQAYTRNTEQIGAVYTLSEERGKGYGKAVVSELCRRTINKGKLPTLVVNKLNTPAIKAYDAIGFEHCGDYLIIRLYG